MKPSFPGCIVSGGQTGADRAALDFAIAHGVTHAGFCPRGRRAEDGPLSLKYNLEETETTDYPERTRKNVDLADATIIFSRRPVEALKKIKRGSGTALTVRECERAGRPFVVLAAFPDVPADIESLTAFLRLHPIRILNVAGHSEAHAPGIYRHVLAVLAAVLAILPVAAVPANYRSATA